MGAEVIHRKGYHAAGVQEILNAANVPKGSFYNHFKSKEDFGLQVINFFVDFFDQFCKDVFEDSSGSPLGRIERLLDRFTEFFDSKGCTYGCPVGNLAQELGDVSPVFQKKLSEAIDKMLDYYTEVLSEA